MALALETEVVADGGVGQDDTVGVADGALAECRVGVLLEHGTASVGHEENRAHTI